MDNRGAVSLTRGAGDSNRTKHIDIRYHFIRSHVEDKRIEVQFLPIPAPPYGYKNGLAS